MTMPARAPFFIGLAGPSCSGKTSIAQQIAAGLPGTATVFGTDSYYLDLSHLTPAERARQNFDDPGILESALLAQHLQSLRRGERICQPVYDFSTHSRIQGREEIIHPSDFLIVEGLFILHWPDVRAMFDLRVFIATEDETCLERRKARDVRDRGRTVESVVSQYAATVRPGAQHFVLPSKAHADLVVNGHQPIEISARQIVNSVRRRLDTPSALHARV